MPMLTDAQARTDLLNRLKRAEGQLRGVQRMIEEGQPPGRGVDRAARHTQREREQDEAAGKDVDQAVDGHAISPGGSRRRRFAA